jgi:uncharacterized protein DUF4157
MSYLSRLYNHRNVQSPEVKNEKPFFSKKHNDMNSAKGAFFQAKLSVNQPGDSYEREADSVANAVVNKSAGKQAVHQNNISSIQRLATTPEEEKVSTNDGRMERDKEKPYQLQAKSNDEEKMKDEENAKKSMPVQKKQDGGTATASSQISSKIESSAGRGNRLPSKTLHEMNSSFGADFNNVRIHNDTESSTMNKELQAHAFTHGNDIYFNSGKYNPENSDGKFLLAHELTHVLQQNAGIRKKHAPSKPEIITKAPGFDGTTDGTYIASISVSININGKSEINLTWANAEVSQAKNPDFVLPTGPFKTSPGAGQCNRDCSDTVQSNLTDSNCTPAGNFLVEGFAPRLSDDGRATSVTFYKQSRGIAFHYYTEVPEDPQSHGCTRMEKTEHGADWIRNNSIKGVTAVNVTATGNADTRKECYYGKTKMKMDDYEKISIRDRILHWFKFGTQHKGGDDGKFYLREAMRYANGLNDDDIKRLLRGKGKKELQEMYEATISAPGVGAESNLAKMIWDKLNPPVKPK